jgi:3-oxoacyl-[acyl-carrier-protein] synthase-3
MTGLPRIVGVGINLPEKIVTNADLEKVVDTSDEWIASRTGIRARRIAEAGTTASQQGIPAALAAMEEAGVGPADLDLILCATSTPDMLFPSTACLIQSGVGAAGCPAFDLLAACSGYVYALSVAEMYIKAGQAKTVLIVASEILSSTLDWTDRGTCVLFGDAAAATVVTLDESGAGVIGSKLAADGSYAEFLTVGVGSANPYTAPGFNPTDSCLKMKGNSTFKLAIAKMSEVSADLLAAHGYTVDDVSLVVPHQANKRIIDMVAKTLGLPDEKMFVNIDKYGNTSAATIPLALYEARQQGRIKPGDLIVTVALGGGFTWGANLIRW